MNLETEIYQILRKHRLSLKKREEVIVDLLDFIKKRDEAINYTRCSLQLPTIGEIENEAEIRNPLEKHIVDWNNGKNEGFIDGGEWVLNIINGYIKR